MSWTVDRVVELERRAAAGESADAIAAALELDAAQVEGKAFRMGLRLGQGVPPAPAPRPTAREVVAAPPIAAAPPAERPTSDVVAAPGRAKEGWTAERIAWLKRRHGEGVSFGVIARELDLTRNAVIGKAMRIGLRGDGVRRAPSAPVVRQALPRGGGGGVSVARISAPRPATAAPRPKAAPVARAKVPAGPVGLRFDQPRLAPAPNRRSPADIERARSAHAAALSQLSAAQEAGFPDKTDILGLTSTRCRFPLWAAGAPCGPGEGFFCGAAKPAGETPPYCRGHAALCVQPPVARRAA